jgi:hypothetical protein
MHLDTRDGISSMRFDVGDRLAVVVPGPGFDALDADHGERELGRIVSPIVTLLAGDREVTWPAAVIDRAGHDRIGCGWIADDSDAVLAVWDVHHVGDVPTDYTLLLDPPAGEARP